MKTIFITILAAIIGAVLFFSSNQPIVEGWAGMDGMRSVYVERVAQNPQTGELFSMGKIHDVDPVSCGPKIGGGTDRAVLHHESYTPLHDTYSSLPSPALDSNQTQFFSTANFQANLSPRFNPHGYGAFINYKPTDQENLAVPRNPLGYNTCNYNPTIEGYNQGTQSCVQAPIMPYELPSGYTNGNYNQVYEAQNGQVVSNSCGNYGSGNNAIPSGTLTLTDADGNPTQYLTQDRYMFSTKKSRLWGQQDMIRGSLPIVPDASVNNFKVSVNLASDVNTGALGIMAGQEAVDPNMIRLMSHAKGHQEIPMAGININTNMSDAYTSGSCAGINLTAFP